MTVRVAASHAQVATSTVQNWRSGHVPSDFIAVKRLSNALGVTFSFLLTGEDDSQSLGRRRSVTECFEFDEVMFDGYARLTIQKLHPFSAEDNLRESESSVGDIE